jgi:hypothetical protein
MGASKVVIVVGIFKQNAAKVSFVDDQDMIQAFFSDRADPTLSKCIRSPVRSVNDIKTFREENRVKPG